MEPTHPDRLVENVTAPSVGGFPGPDGEVRLRMRLPFRTGSSNLELGWAAMIRLMSVDAAFASLHWPKPLRTH
jgi:hypothetical protein